VSRGLSIYLDLLRFLAALQVALYHVALNPGVALPTMGWNQWGHEAVVVFFVLSGFVINHAAETREKTCLDFAASRIARIYSVVIPCIVLTVLFDVVGLRIAPDVYRDMHIDDAWQFPGARILISGLLLNNSWVPVQMFSNVPFWSVCYEFWYYFLFAAAFYFEGRQRIALVALAAFFAGPRALIVMPIWLMGVWVFRAKLDAGWSKVLLGFALVQPVLVLAAYHQLGLKEAGFAITTGWVDGKWLDNGSAFILTDFWLGLSFALHLLAAKRWFASDMAAVPLRWLEWAEGPIRALAARSFTLYLIHLPLMFVLTAVLSLGVQGGLLTVMVMIGTVGLPLLMGSVIEGQRHRLRPLVVRGLVHWIPGLVQDSGPRDVVRLRA
jgi:peptidoglycan/LPS O-acetylase OafA/YrhL